MPSEFNKILPKLLGKYQIFAPTRENDKIVVKEIHNINEIDWSGDLPWNTFKEIFLPSKETLLNYNEKGAKTTTPANVKPILVLGMNVLDLQALTLFEQVFSRDNYFVERRRNITVAGFSRGLKEDNRKYKTFTHTFEENFLEHLNFDVFIQEITEKGNGAKKIIKLYSGSEKGQKFWEKSGITDYEHIEFAGPIKESGPDAKMLDLKNKMMLSADNPVWQELGKRCLACGKCSIACPTCFCFDLQDEIKDNTIEKTRHWGNCFYNEFSQVAGNVQVLDTVAKRIYFWYYHKFVRIPHEFSIPGCVSCMRCFKVCPVKINIVETLKALENN